MTKRLAPELRRVRRAANHRQRAEREYMESLVAARDAKFSASDIGDAAGTTRQNVLKLTNRRPT